MARRFTSLLVQDRVVSIREMDDVLRAQRRRGGRVGTNLLELTQIDEAQMLRYLARALEMEPAPSSAYMSVERDLAQLLRAPDVQRLQAIPLRRRNGRVEVLVLDPLSDAARTELEVLLEAPVDALLTLEHRFYVVAFALYDLEVPERYRALAERFPTPIGYLRTEDAVPSSAALRETGGDESGRTASTSSLAYLGAGEESGQFAVAETLPAREPSPDRPTAHPDTSAPGSSQPPASAAENVAAIEGRTGTSRGGAAGQADPAAKPQQSAVEAKGPPLEDVLAVCARIAASRDRDTLFGLTLNFSLQLFLRALLITRVSDGRFRVIAGRHADRELSLDRSPFAIAGDQGALGRAFGARSHLIRAGDDHALRALYEHAGLEPARDIVLLPVQVRGRTILLLAGDCGTEEVNPVRLTPIFLLLRRLDDAIADLIKRRRALNTSQVPAVPESAVAAPAPARPEMARPEDPTPAVASESPASQSSASDPSAEASEPAAPSAEPVAEPDESRAESADPLPEGREGDPYAAQAAATEHASPETAPAAATEHASPDTAAATEHASPETAPAAATEHASPDTAAATEHASPESAPVAATEHASPERAQAGQDSADPEAPTPASSVDATDAPDAHDPATPEGGASGSAEILPPAARDQRTLPTGIAVEAGWSGVESRGEKVVSKGPQDTGEQLVAAAALDGETEERPVPVREAVRALRSGAEGKSAALPRTSAPVERARVGGQARTPTFAKAGPDGQAPDTQELVVGELRERLIRESEHDDAFSADSDTTPTSQKLEELDLSNPDVFEALPDADEEGAAEVRELNALVERLAREPVSGAARILALRETMSPDLWRDTIMAHFPGPLVLDRRVPVEAERDVHQHGPLLRFLHGRIRPFVRPLLRFALDGNDDVSWYALRVLSGHVAPAALAPVATSLVYRSDPSLRALGVELLQQARGTDAAADGLRKLRRDAESGAPHLKDLAIRALGELRDEDAVHLLVLLLASPSPRLRSHVARALEQITLQRFGTHRMDWERWYASKGHLGMDAWLCEAMVDPSEHVRRNAAHVLSERGDLRVQYDPSGSPADHRLALRILQGRLRQD